MNQSDMPNAKTIGIKYETSSSLLVIYPLINCGIKPIDVTAPAINPMISSNVESIFITHHPLYFIKDFQKIVTN